MRKVLLLAALATIPNLAEAQTAQSRPDITLTPFGHAQIAKNIGSFRDSQDTATRFPIPTCMFPRGLCGAVGLDGKTVVQPKYDWIGKFFDGRAAVRLGGVYGYVDEAGREVVQPTYRIAGDFRFGFAEVDVAGKSTVIDREGRQMFEPRFGSIRAIAPDQFEVSDMRRLGGRPGAEDFSGFMTEFTRDGGVSISETGFLTGLQTGVIDSAGNWIRPYGTSQPINFDQADPSVRWVQKDKLWGLARADGSWIVDPKFVTARPASDGLALVSLSGKFGYVDKTGSLVIEPVFDEARTFVGGQAAVRRDGTRGVIDKSGAWVFQAQVDSLQPNLGGNFGSQRTLLSWTFKVGNRFGLRDLTGRTVLEAQFDQAVTICTDGRIVGYQNKKWLLFKPDGTPLQPPGGEIVNGAGCESKPPFAFRIGDKIGTIDGNGQVIVPAQFDTLRRYADGTAIVLLEGKWGRIGADGRWLIEPRFNHLSGSEHLYVAGVGGLRGFLRPDQTWLIEPRYEAAALHRPDSAIVTVEGKSGLMKLSDQSWIIAPRPGALCTISGVLLAKSERQRAMFSDDGTLILEVEAESITLNPTDGLLSFRRDGKWGLVDTAGTIIAEPNLETDNPYFTRGMLWARQGERWCPIDRRGRVQNQPDCRLENPSPRTLGIFECTVEY